MNSWRSSSFLFGYPKNAEIMPWLYSWKTFFQFGHPKKLQTPPTNPQLATIFFSCGHPNKYAKFLQGDEKKHQNNNNDLICS
jgi:hypothetical protein